MNLPQDIYVTNPEHDNLVETFLIETFLLIYQQATERAFGDLVTGGFVKFDEKIPEKHVNKFYRATLWHGMVLWKEEAERFNKTPRTLHNEDGTVKPFSMDVRGFAMMIGQLPDLRKPFIPFLEELMSAEFNENPEMKALKVKLEPAQPKVNKDALSKLTPIDQIPYDRLTAEMFRTMEMLKTYRPNADYDDVTASKISEHLEAILKRMHTEQ